MYAVMWKNKEGNYEWQDNTVFDRQIWETRYMAEKALTSFYVDLAFSDVTKLLTSDIGWRIVEIQKVHKSNE